jgi:alkylhydroperoxidase family enzyme
MAIVEPIPYEELSQEARARIDAGLASGMYSTSAPLQVVAHSPVALRALDEGYKAQFRTGAIEQRLQELLRLRSAAVHACRPCAASRKDASVGEEDVACLAAPDEWRYSRREVAALRFFDRFATDPVSLTVEALEDLAEVFDTEELVELVWLCGQFVGVHRFMHVVGLLSASGVPDGVPPGP